MKRVRDLAVGCARTYVESREKLGFPLLNKDGDGSREMVPEVADAAR
jgi:hypothetical protein